jgi:Apea-like HEPN
MPLEIHPKCKARLVETVSTALSELQVLYCRFVSRGLAGRSLRAAELALPTKGPVRDQLTKYIGQDFPLSDFILNTLDEELQRFPFADNPDPKPLTSIDGYQNTLPVAERLIKNLENLPQRYTFTIKLPSTLTPIMDVRTKIELSPRIRLVRTTPELAQLYPREMNILQQASASAGLLNALIQRPPNWAEDGLYLQLDTQGFVGLYGGSSTYLEVVRLLRAFCGLGLALRLFDMKSEHFPSTPAIKLEVHRQSGVLGMQHFKSFDLDDNISRAVDGLSPHTLDGWINSPQRQEIWVDSKFGEMRSVFNGGRKSDAILLACQWFFDGHSHGPDELLKFIQTMVVLEILLGDKATSDQTGLNVLLRNRCAYLIGNSQEDRNQVLDLFNSIYDIRSQIVHSGKHRLSTRESILFRQLRWLCRRVIFKEIQLHKADDKSEAAPG